MKLHIKALAAMALAASLMLSLDSCSSKKSVLVNQQPKVALANLTGRLAAVDSSLLAWQSVKMPVTMKLTSPASLTLGGSMTLVHDRAICLSLRFMGMIEVATVCITADTVTVIDKYHKKYFREGVADLLAGVPLSIGNIQDLLLGRPFVLGSGSFATAPAELTALSPASWMSEPQSALKPWHYRFSFDAANMLTGVGLAKDTATKATVEYTDATLTSPIGMMASRASISAGDNGKVQAQLILKSGSATWNKSSVSIPTPPADYQRITLSSLATLLQQI